MLFQTRVRSTTMFPSDMEPWDGILTGEPGRAPSYDPLQFAIDECHKRGLEIHAWIVAFPICKADVCKKLGSRALPRQRPELCQLCGDKWGVDPGGPETGEYLARFCAEACTSTISVTLKNPGDSGTTRPTPNTATDNPRRNGDATM